MAKVYKGIQELIGNTPLVEAVNLEKKLGLKATLLLKLEYFNPAGSVKDRIANGMIEDAEKKGLLKEGATIIEPTSGNTGIGLAAIAAAKGYKAIFTMPETMSVERRNILKAYGAEIVLTPGEKGMSGAIAKADELAEEAEDLNTFFEGVIAYAQEVLSQTPEMLPVLKEAGVVDSGGQGLLEVLKGAYDGYLGKEINMDFEAPKGAVTVSKPAPAEESNIKFGYCTEFIIMLEKPFPIEEEHAFKEYLMSIGDSLVVVADDEIVKVHVHTNEPGNAIQKALTYGQLSNMKIDNMRLEHHEKVIKEAEKMAAMQKEQMPEKEVGFISVSVGDGMSAIFKDLGADYLIEGGQTMNPSTEDVLEAIAKVHAKNIFVFPNNKNIILAANQARDLTEDKNIIVIPTKTIPQGITALINYVPEKTIEENTEEMLESITAVKTGQITYAVRNTKIDEKEIHEGDIMGIGDHGILAVGQDVEKTTLETVEAMVDEDSEIISIYFGAEVSEEEAETLKEALEEKYPDFDIDVNQGGQPIYYYVISVE